MNKRKQTKKINFAYILPITDQGYLEEPETIEPKSEEPETTEPKSEEPEAIEPKSNETKSDL